MNDRDIRREERATRVQTFGSENDGDFAAGGKAKTHFGNLDGLLVQLRDAKAGQSPNRVSKQTLLDALGIDLQNIARTARRIEQKENGFAAPYRLPDNTSESAVTTHTDSVLQKLEDQPADVRRDEHARECGSDVHILFEADARRNCPTRDRM